MTSQEACKIISQELTGKEIGNTAITCVVERKVDREHITALGVKDEELIKRVVDGWHFYAHYIDYEDPEEDSGSYLLSFYGVSLGLKCNEEATPEIIQNWCKNLLASL